MALIYETDNFIIEAVDKPLLSREEGGHIRIYPKIKVSDRTKLSSTLAIEYMKLSMIVGEALMSGLGRRGIAIGIVNYQDMGNWSVFKPEGPYLHTHVFGRATTATIQKYGDAVNLPQRSSGYYDSFKPLNEADIQEIRADIEKLVESEKYSSF